MSFTPAPKPEPREPKVRKWLPRPTKPIARKTWLKHGMKPVPQFNHARIARKAKAYAAVIRSKFHKLLRYLAFQRSGGYCECEECVAVREGRFVPPHPLAILANAERIAQAFTVIPCWFTKGGSEPHLRFRSKDGELHHDSYKLFGEENLAELAFVQWTWKSCHQRIEGEHQTRRRFLKGAR
jgi:hypothetical protein